MLFRSEKARQTSCLSNEKQITLAILQYVQDFDETFPFNQMNAVPEGQKTTSIAPTAWQTVISPYVKNGNLVGGEYANGVWSCPSFPTTGVPRAYGVNNHIFSSDEFPWTDSGNYVPAALASLDAPANKGMLFELADDANAQSTSMYGEQWYWVPGGEADTNRIDLNRDVDKPYTTWPPNGASPRYRHSGTTNVGFADGHVKAMARGSMSGPKGWCKYIFAKTKTNYNAADWYPYNFPNGCTPYE